MQSSLIAAATEPSGMFSLWLVDALPSLPDILMVIGMLAVLWGLYTLVARLVSSNTAKQPAAAPESVATVAARVAAAPAAPEPVPAVAGTPPEIVAVIAAAVATITGRQSRVISIRRIDTSWEKAGRQAVLTSHRIR